MKVFSSLLIIAPAFGGASAFLFPEPMKIRAGLADIADRQPDFNLKILLNIGQENDDTRLAIRGLELGLHKEKPEYEHVKMPGVDGPHPSLSTGARVLNILKEGEFIDGMGTKFVKALKGCWEMVWREEAPAGSLLCGFEIPEEYKRNTAILPKGRIYVSFPIWTKEGLRYAQEKKKEVMDKAKELLRLKDEELAKYSETKNPFMKALHYRNAFAHSADYLDLPKKLYEHVPVDEDVVEIQDDLFLTTKGLVWAKNLPNGKQTLLGSANAFPELAPVTP